MFNCPMNIFLIGSTTKKWHFNLILFNFINILYNNFLLILHPEERNIKKENLK